MWASLAAQSVKNLLVMLDTDHVADHTLIRGSTCTHHVSDHTLITLLIMH